MISHLMGQNSSPSYGLRVKRERRGLAAEAELNPSQRTKAAAAAAAAAATCSSSEEAAAVAVAAELEGWRGRC